MFKVAENLEMMETKDVCGKGFNLICLKKLKMNVPEFQIIPAQTLSDLLPTEILKMERDSIISYIMNIEIPDDFINEITQQFKNNQLFAVRSSAVGEDGSKHSFAGQFDSFLFVPKEQLSNKIKQVWCSLFSPRVIEYRKINNLAINLDMAVIIQEMVDADVSGVAFGINPLTGNNNEKYINAVFGCGEGLVSGQLNSDSYTCINGQIQSSIVNKSQKIIHDPSTGKPVTISIPEEEQHLPTLSNEDVFKIENILTALSKYYSKPQDIEFAIKNKEIFLLQTRPVTTGESFHKGTGENIVWDNSNIIESYPGVTTPLTFSFISQSYETAYKLFAGYMGISPPVIKTNERVFANTLGLINGRVYYNLKSWYHMLAMGPGYSINARYMESMMGVKERFDIPDHYRISKSKAWIGILKMAIGMFRRYISLPLKRKQFVALLNETIANYKKIDFDELPPEELMKLYLNFEKTLLNEWKAPLLNDFFAMIGYGVLQKRCKSYGIAKWNPNIHNDLLCGSNDIISVQPIHRTMELASMILNDQNSEKLFKNNNETIIWRKISESNDYDNLKTAIQQYISEFGERCIGELKLESISYTQDPSKFIKVLKCYVEEGITKNSISGRIDEDIRKKAEAEVSNTLKNNWIKRKRLNNSIKLARTLVSSRENLRYERTRAFGMVRAIFVAIGKGFYKINVIDNERDIFYLTKPEIFSFIEGTSVTQNIRELIDVRKKEFQGYQNQKAPSERFETFGAVYTNNDFFNTSKVENIEGELKGIGCCPGIVRGKVQVILNPTDAISLKGDILVASSTDPGWVILFPGASGIITERGSVLSHSAIVSREMGKPCIVNVPGLMKTLKTGDEIQMDGSTGIITVLNS